MILEIFKKSYNLILGLLFKKSFFGFVQGHDYLTKEQVTELQKMVGSPDQEIIRDQFKEEFKRIFDLNNVYTFASGRMAFFTILKVLKIKVGDEVIVTGFTCSVMINAILRTKATPVFTDIDDETLGSSPIEIQKAITEKTKVIVAQHSFGIPCKIDEIVSIGKKQNIYVIEDCAISLGSKYKGKLVGSYGDAAIFSTDHSKPINTMIGGLASVKDDSLYKKVEVFMSDIDELSTDHQNRIFKQFQFERLYYNSSNLLLGKVIQLFNRVILRKELSETFLDQDYSSDISLNHVYSYPAKLPGFIAKLGLFELERWSIQYDKRRKLLQKFIDVSKDAGIAYHLPKAYLSDDFDIVPLRFVYSNDKIDTDIKFLSNHIDLSWFWFKEPIITCESPQEFNYKYGSCPISEKIGQQIINWPCNLNLKEDKKIISLFKQSIALN